MMGRYARFRANCHRHYQSRWQAMRFVLSFALMLSWTFHVYAQEPRPSRPPIIPPSIPPLPPPPMLAPPIPPPGPLPLAPLPPVPPRPGQIRSGRIEIVNKTNVQITFDVKCGVDKTERELLAAQRNVEYSCLRRFQVSMKTKGKTQIVRSLETETRNEIFWDEENKVYDIRELE